MSWLGRKKRSRGITFTGDYSRWEDAVKDSTGYDSNVILEKTRDALLKVKNGEAAYERDSVLFDKIQHSFPVLAGLLRAAEASQGKLCVVDFGGALGSTYFQCRGFLNVVKELKWFVVEQPAHVACGREHFVSGQLHFCGTVAECMKQDQPNVLLLSGVLQYLPNPYEFLAELLSHGIPHVIVDRAPFLSSGRDRLTVQTVPGSIYPASYPAWFFGEDRFITAIAAAGYSIVTDFPGSDTVSPEDEASYFKGFILERRAQKA